MPPNESFAKEVDFKTLAVVLIAGLGLSRALYGLEVNIGINWARYSFMHV